MRIGIISDIHGNLVALQAVLSALQRLAPDVTVNLGDCVTSPLWPRETMELLGTLGIPTVRGNHDRWLTTVNRAEMTASMGYTFDALNLVQRAALHALPPKLALDGDILAVHGTPTSDESYLLEDSVDGRLALARRDVIMERLGSHRASLVLCGHSHDQRIAAGEAHTLFVNPGSVGCPRYADNADFDLAEASSPHARFAVATRVGPRWSVELKALAYEWSPVVARAVSNSRGDWARGFLA